MSWPFLREVPTFPLFFECSFPDELAWEAMSRITKEFPGEVTLVAIGPLTNVAIGWQALCVDCDDGGHDGVTMMMDDGL